MHKWLEVDTSNLWPYGVRLANEVKNHSQCTINGLIALAIFAKTSRIHKISQLQAFKCTSSVLVFEMQAKKMIDK